MQHSQLTGLQLQANVKQRLCRAVPDIEILQAQHQL
jgi:hypothetical protein